ncbi:MAG: 3'-5' exoribonuclease YhaM family protein [Candidatus Zhuqueibacterota bacterium]
MVQKLISELNPGDSVIAFFVIRKKEIKFQKSSQEMYLSLEFGDRSGRIRGSLWKGVPEMNKFLLPGDIVKVKGKVITFLEQPYITIEKIRKAKPDDTIDPAQFLPVSAHDVAQLLADVQQRLASITDAHLKTLSDTFLNDQEFVDAFCSAPGGKLWHHACIGGLLEHTLSVMKIAALISDHYGDSINKDLLMTASFLHDIGKIEEFSAKGFIDYSTPGRLLGHIAIAANLISEKMRQFNGFPDNVREQLLHCILSHHGQKERGSPVIPMTLEALILAHADELDSSVAAFSRIISREKEPGKEWSNYVNLIDRFIYLGEE